MNDLLGSYVKAIGARLPKKNRADIEAEIRSTLEDMLADRSAETGRPVDEAMVKEMLIAYGAPEKVAATYLPERYLIGPRLYPIFILVLKIVLAVVSVVALVGLGIAFTAHSGGITSFFESLGKAFLQYLGSVLTAFANIVLVFAILERVIPAEEWKDEKGAEKAWDPAELLKQPSPDTISLWEPVVTIVFTCVGLALFNFYPQVIGFIPSLNNLGTGQVTFIPILSDAFFTYLPWLNLIWLLTIVLNAFLLREGAWSLFTRLGDIAIKAMGIALAVAMFNGPALIALNPAAMAAAGIESASAQTLENLLNQLVRIALIIGIIGGAFDILRGIYRLFARGIGANPAYTR